MKHLMLDFETLATGKLPVVLSIGAVEFDLETGEMGKSFYRNVEINDQISRGFQINGDTLLWWLGQSEKARKPLISGEGQNIKDMLDDFRAFYLDCESPIIWGNGLMFDVRILGEIVDAVGLRRFWHYRNEADYRTIKNMFPKHFENEKAGNTHNPIDDCKNQIKLLCVLYSKINIKD